MNEMGESHEPDVEQEEYQKSEEWRELFDPDYEEGYVLRPLPEVQGLSDNLELLNKIAETAALLEAKKQEGADATDETVRRGMAEFIDIGQRMIDQLGKPDVEREQSIFSLLQSRLLYKTGWKEEAYESLEPFFEFPDRLDEFRLLALSWKEAWDYHQNMSEVARGLLDEEAFLAFQEDLRRGSYDIGGTHAALRTALLDSLTTENPNADISDLENQVTARMQKLGFEE